MKVFKICAFVIGNGTLGFVGWNFLFRESSPWWGSLILSIIIVAGLVVVNLWIWLGIDSVIEDEKRIRREELRKEIRSILEKDKEI